MPRLTSATFFAVGWLTVKKSTRGKPTVGAMQRGNPAQLTHAACVNVVFRLKTNTDCFLCLTTLTFVHEINEFPGLKVEHVYVKSGDPNRISFWHISCEKTDKQLYTQTHKQMQLETPSTRPPWASAITCTALLLQQQQQSNSWLKFNVPYQHKYGCIKDERLGWRAIPTQ